MEDSVEYSDFVADADIDQNEEFEVLQIVTALTLAFEIEFEAKENLDRAVKIRNTLMHVFISTRERHKLRREASAQIPLPKEELE
jgi:hypothetical protein